MRNFNILKKAIFIVFVLTVSIFQGTNIAEANTLILDNGQPGTSFNGTWKVSIGANPYGSNSLYADANGASYTFNVDLATPGEYQVFARWTEYSNRRTSVPYDIVHKTGTSTVNVNQQQNGGTWQKLGGTWTFNNQATIRIRSLGNGTTNADAIKLVYVGSTPEVSSTSELDNGQPGTSFNGTWKVSIGADPYGNNSLYADANGASYTFNVDLATPGEYQVFARWTEYSNRRTSVPYDIVHKTGTSTVNVNQQQNGGTWQKLGGTWTFNNQATIRIRSLGNGTTNADAIKLVYVGSTPGLGGTPELDNGQSGTSLSAFPVDLRGSTPEEASITISVSKPQNAGDAIVTLATYDADFSNEGELVINGNLPVKLFGSAGVGGNDQNSADISFRTPASYWLNGNNTLVFRHMSTHGFVIDAATVSFESVPGGSGTAQTGSAVLNWTAPVARADGTALALSEIAGYTVYYGTVAGNYPNSLDINDLSATSVSITNLPLDTYYMVVTTRDSDGRESVQSSMVVKLVQ